MRVFEGQGGGMQVVYEAMHLIDAYLVRHALEDAGIPVFVRGEALVGGIGELPACGLVAVCVPDAAWPQARTIVESLALASGEAPADEDAPWPTGVAQA
jgi:hypothetical protein